MADRMDTRSGSKGLQAVAGVAWEAFARWLHLHHRYAPVGVEISFRRVILILLQTTTVGRIKSVSHLARFLQNGTTYCKRRVCPVLDCAESANNGTMTSSNDVTNDVTMPPRCCRRCAKRKRRCAHASTRYKVYKLLPYTGFCLCI